MNWWQKWHERRAWLRVPVKLLLLAVVVAVTLYPRLDYFQTWVGRLRNIGSLLDPAHPGLASFEADARAQLTSKSDPAEALRVVEKVVYARVPYAWDWDTWGVVDYLPTVDEVLKLGREDCDGRAVIAASLLRRMGYEAQLVSDVLHVWVDTPAGATMRPTSAEKTIVSTPTGTKVNITPGVVRNLGRGMTYGVGAFPLGREAIILAALALLTMQPRSSVWRRIAGCLMLWIALTTLREAGIKAAMDGSLEHVAKSWGGWGMALAGWLTLAIRAGGAPRGSAAPQPV
jgi:hypothetical protein